LHSLGNSNFSENSPITPSKSTGYKMKALFALEIAFATCDFDQTVSRGSIDFQGFLTEFRAFDWSGETNRTFWNRKSSPGVGVTNQTNGSTLWVMAYDWLSPMHSQLGPFAEPALSFVIGVNNGFEPPDIYSLEKNMPMVDCHFETSDKAEIEDLFLAFFDQRHADVYEKLFTLPLSNVEVD